MTGKEELMARMKQIAALDSNAIAVYRQLAAWAPDERLKTTFKAISHDEQKHVRLMKRMIEKLARANKD
jgi:rubrerythrin